MTLNNWVWRRLVARYLGVVEAAGSNPVTQTSNWLCYAKQSLFSFLSGEHLMVFGMFV